MPSQESSLHLPINRSRYAECGNHQPGGWFQCNRAKDHSGRHAFYWRHLDGRVRGVWT